MQKGTRGSNHRSANAIYLPNCLDKRRVTSHRPLQVGQPTIVRISRILPKGTQSFGWRSRKPALPLLSGKTCNNSHTVPSSVWLLVVGYKSRVLRWVSPSGHAASFLSTVCSDPPAVSTTLRCRAVCHPEVVWLPIATFSLTTYLYSIVMRKVRPDLAARLLAP